MIPTDPIQRLTEAVSLLREYAGHDEYCSFLFGPEPGHRCRCGWSEISARVDALLQPQTEAANG